MKATVLVILMYSSCLFFIKCSDKNKDNFKDSNVAALVENKPITLNVVDNSIRQEIFDELNRIYLIRKIALDDIIKESVLSIEAAKRNVTVNELIDSVYQSGTIDKLKKYIKSNQFEKGVPAFERTLIHYDIQTDKGKEILAKRFKTHLLNDFTDSLKIKYNIKILLTRPESPIFEFNDALIHYRNYDKKKVNFILISDFECNMCRDAYKIIDGLVKRYEDKINFGFVNYGSYPTVSAIASECASKQNNFWPMHDSLFALESLPDTSDIFRFAKNIGLIDKDFRKDFYDKNLENAIESNILKIMNSGIYATPTIVIGNKAIFNSSSLKEIEEILISTISKSN